MALRVDYPFLMNDEFDFEHEKKTWNNIMDEGTYLYGAECLWIRQELNVPDNMFGDFLGKLIKEGVPIRLIIDQIEEDFYPESSLMYSKFGIEPNIGSATFHASVNYFENFAIEPRPQDLIFYKKVNKIFEVTHVTLLDGFKYQIDSVLYDYDHTKIDDGVTDEDILSLETLDDKDKIQTGDKTNIAEQTQEDTSPVLDVTDKDGIFG